MKNIQNEVISYDNVKELGEMIAMLVKEIIVFNDKIEIHYNSPMLSPDESRGFSFI